MKKKFTIGEEVRVLYGPFESTGTVLGFYPQNIVAIDILGKSYACHSSQLFPKN